MTKDEEIATLCSQIEEEKKLKLIASLRGDEAEAALEAAQARVKELESSAYIVGIICLKEKAEQSLAAALERVKEVEERCGDWYEKWASAGHELIEIKGERDTAQALAGRYREALEAIEPWIPCICKNWKEGMDDHNPICLKGRARKALSAPGTSPPPTYRNERRSQRIVAREILEMDAAKESK